MHVNTVSTGMNGCFSRWDRMSRASFLPTTVNMTNSRNPGILSLSRLATRLHGPHRCSIVVDGTEYRRGIDTTIHQGYQGHQYSVFYQQLVLESTFYDSSSTRAITTTQQSNTRPSALAVVRSETDSSTFDRLDSWGSYWSSRLNGETIPMSIRPVTTGCFVSSSVNSGGATSRVAPISGRSMTKVQAGHCYKNH
jgi:hypothetical protein